LTYVASYILRWFTRMLSQATPPPVRQLCSVNSNIVLSVTEHHKSQTSLNQACHLDSLGVHFRQFYLLTGHSVKRALEVPLLTYLLTNGFVIAGEIVLHKCCVGV